MEIPLEDNATAITPKLPRFHHDDVPSEYRLQIIQALGVTGFNEEDFSLDNVICPFHPDDRPSAQVHRRYGLYCFHGKGWICWIDVGDKLGLGSLSDYYLDRSVVTPVQLSTETREALLRSGLASAARVLDILYQSGCTPGEALSIAEIADACARYTVALSSIYRVVSTQIEDDGKDNFSQKVPSYLFQQVLDGKKEKNKDRGRTPAKYILPEPAHIAKLMKIQSSGRQHYDPMQEQALQSIKNYRAEVHAAFVRRFPGMYTRAWLGERIGVCGRTIYTYDNLVDIQVTPNHKRQELDAFAAACLPDKRRDAPGNQWLEDDFGNRFPPVRRAAEMLLRRGLQVWLVKRLANTYAPKSETPLDIGKHGHEADTQL